MTQPHTDLPEWFRFRFRVSLPRWVWRLEDVDGKRCLVAVERRREPPFTGDPDLLARLTDLNEADDSAVERFANRYTGLYAGSSATPAAEVLDAIRSEAIALHGLRQIGRAGLVRNRPKTRGMRRGLAALLDGALEFMTVALEEARAEVRPLDDGHIGTHGSARVLSPGVRAGPEWQLMEWVQSTVEETWRLELPMDEWLADPLHRRARAFARVMPEVRCLTLLGYAYAQLIAQLQAREAQAGSLTRRPVLCRSCGTLLSEYGSGGRRRRSDARWCEECRRKKNAQRQAVRRHQRAAREDIVGRPHHTDDHSVSGRSAQ